MKCLGVQGTSFMEESTSVNTVPSFCRAQLAAGGMVLLSALATHTRGFPQAPAPCAIPVLQNVLLSP